MYVFVLVNGVYEYEWSRFLGFRDRRSLTLEGPDRRLPVPALVEF